MRNGASRSKMQGIEGTASGYGTGRHGREVGTRFSLRRAHHCHHGRRRLRSNRCAATDGDDDSSPDAMIFYVAHGAAGACGPGCADWIAAEGTVQWDTHKRLIAILDRQGGRKLPVVIHARATPISTSRSVSAASCVTAASTPRSASPTSLPATTGATRIVCAQASGRAARRHAQHLGSALRYRLRVDVGRRRPSQRPAGARG